jgi:hypothetical protein
MFARLGLACLAVAGSVLVGFPSPAGADDTDTTPPVIDFTLVPNPADGDNGWWVGEVLLGWQVTDDESPDSLSITGCEPQDIVEDQAPTGYSCSATSAGGSAGPVTVTIGRDATAPTIDAAATLPDTSPYAPGAWTNQDVTVTYTCDDNLSGVVGCPAADVLTDETTADGTDVSQNVFDAAGNKGSSRSINVRIDKTAPKVTVTGVVDGGFYLTGSVPTASCDSLDELSGLATAASVSLSATTVNGVGTVTATCSGALDNAGNPGSEQVSYLVAYGGLSGILQPISPDNTSVFSRGKPVPVKFRLAGDEPRGFVTSGWTLARQQVSCTDFEPVATPDLATTLFRYDAKADQYINNVSFKDKPPSTCWKAVVTLDSGQKMSSAAFRLQK